MGLITSVSITITAGVPGLLRLEAKLKENPFILLSTGRGVCT